MLPELSSIGNDQETIQQPIFNPSDPLSAVQGGGGESGGFTGSEASVSSRRLRGRRQGVYWMGTIPHYGFTPYLPGMVRYIKGQLELGVDQQYLHWQLLVVTQRKCSLAQLRECFGPWHFELTRSKAAEGYVWKEATRVDGTQFELGSKPFDRSNADDWELIWNYACTGQILSIPADIRIRSYSTLRRIGEAYMEPSPMQRSCTVLWGRTHTGKSHRAYEEAGMGCYFKDPRTKFWCGYRGQKHVVINEFRGAIDISHLLNWTDWYPCSFEVKGGAVPSCVEKFWITSNIPPESWWPDVDRQTVDAFLRRVRVIEMNEVFVFPS